MRDGCPPLRDARRRDRVPGGDHGLGPRAPTTSSCLSWANATTATWPTPARSRAPTSSRGRGARRGRRRGQRRRRHRDAAASTSRAGSGRRRAVVGEHSVGVLLLCNFGDARVPRRARHTLDPPGARVSRRRLVHRRLRDRRAAVGPAAPAPRAAAAARTCARRLLRLALVGRDRLRVLDRGRRRRARGSARRLLRRRLRGGARGRAQLPRRRAPAERLDGTMQDAFPVELVRRLAAERADERFPPPRGGRRPRAGADPPRHVEPAGQRDAGRRAARRVPARRGRRLRAGRPGPGPAEPRRADPGQRRGTVGDAAGPHRRGSGADRGLDRRSVRRRRCATACSSAAAPPT